jgi:4-methyl-5(b-hydroxyethyl)-thiazole monophosphate biosynthesis
MKIAVLFAEGFEEIEAVTPVDVLKRAGLDVLMVGLDNTEVCGSHDIVFKMDCLLEDIFADDLDMLILPGGLPGSYHLRDSDAVIELVCDLHALNKYIAAICAAPLVLEKAGILEGKRVTSYPAMEDEITSCDEYTSNRIEVDGNIITARGAGCAFEFSFALLEVLGLADKATELKKAMIVSV